MKLSNLNKTVLSISIYTFFLAFILNNDFLLLPAFGMLFTAIASEYIGQYLQNRSLPVKKIENVVEEPKQEIVEQKPEIKVFKIERENAEFDEKKNALIKKAMENGYKIVREKIIPEELKL